MKNIRLPILILLSFLAPCLALVLCAGLVCIVFPPASGTFLGLSLMAGIVLAGLGLGLAALRAACRRVTGLRALTLRATAFAEEVEKGNFTVSLSPSSHEGFEKLFTAMRGIRRELQGKTEEAARRTREARELVEVNERIIAQAEGRSRFFNNISHEIRTPMNAILGMAEIILTSGGLSDSQVRRVNDIRVSSENLLAIINDILDIAKLTSGSMPLVSVNFDFRTLVENVAALGANLAAVKGLHFAFNVEGEMPGYLLGDDVRIRQVLLNLIGNAVKFTSQGRVSLTVHIFDETLSFVVSDTGSGIKKEDLSKIFDPFTQAEYAKNRSIKGTGLGLYISKSLTERMNGRINVESEYGKGSVFTVVLPKRVGKETAPAPKPNVVPYDYDKSLKLLMVDDNEVNLHVVVELMGIWYGLTCDVAVSGHQALEKIAAEDYDIVFMDHMMSDMDGVETTALIRGMGGKYATLPIVAFTANAMSGAREMLLRSGMNAFISKPLLKNNMDEVLNAWVPEHLRVINPAGPDGESGQAQGEGAKDETASVLLRGAADIVGLNVAHGLDLAGGVAEVYEGTLRLLSGKLPQIGKALGKAGERGDFASLRIHAHSLKSSLALIGADELSGMARDLEDVAVTQDLERSREHLSALLRQLRSIGQDLAVLCKSSVKIQSKSAGNAADLSLDLQSLRAGLAAFRYDEVTTSLKKLEAFDYGPDVTAILASVKTCIETFDYEGALAQLGFDPDEM